MLLRGPGAPPRLSRCTICRSRRTALARLRLACALPRLSAQLRLSDCLAHCELQLLQIGIAGGAGRPNGHFSCACKCSAVRSARQTDRVGAARTQAPKWKAVLNSHRSLTIVIDCRPTWTTGLAKNYQLATAHDRQPQSPMSSSAPSARLVSSRNHSRLCECSRNRESWSTTTVTWRTSERVSRHQPAPPADEREALIILLNNHVPR